MAKRRRFRWAARCGWRHDCFLEPCVRHRRPGWGGGAEAGQYANAMILAPIDPGGNIYLKNTSETSFQLWVLLLAYA